MSPPSSTLFPYTTLFRSCLHIEERVGVSGDTTQGAGDQPAAGEDAADRQGLLFDGSVTPVSEDLGYRGPTACAAAGITYRQLDYWARTGLVTPSVRNATGSGSQRLYSFRDILVLKVVKRLLDTGVSLQQIRQAVTHLRAHGVQSLASITLMSDGEIGRASSRERVDGMGD